MDKDPFEMSNEELKKGIMASLSEVQGDYKGNWIVDIGVNIGSFIECALSLFPDSSILGFEPVRRYYEYAYNKFRKHPNVFLERYAIGNRKKMDVIHVAKNNVGWNTLVQERIDEDNRGQIEVVEIIPFDIYLAESGFMEKIDIVKIDTEGYEFRVLNGMMGFLEEQKPVILCEIGWGNEHPYREKELRAFECLYEIGYSRENEEYIKGATTTIDVIFRCEK